MTMKSNIYWGAFVVCMIPFHAMALDLDQLEATVSSQLCQGKNCRSDCDNALHKRIGQDLPSDADACHAGEQYRLLAQGLYRTTKGETKSLKQEFIPVARQERIDLPDIQTQPVTEKTSPYAIDLSTDIKSKGAAESRPSESILHDVSSGRSQ